MSFMKRLEDKFFDKLIKDKDFSEKEIKMFNKIREGLHKFFNNIFRPIVFGISAFYIFTRIKTKIGIEDTFFVIGVVIIILLRGINKKLSELLG